MKFSLPFIYKHVSWERAFSLANQLRFGLLLLVLLGSLPPSGILIYLSFRAQIEQTQLLQHERSQATATQVRNYIDDLQRKIGYLARVRGLTGLSAQVQQQLIEGLIRHNAAYEAVAILDAQGHVTAHVSAYETIHFDNNMATSAAFVRAFKQQEEYVGFVEIDSATQLPMTLMAVPIRNPSDVVDGVLVARINLNFLWFVVSQTQIGETGYTYIVDDRSRLIVEKGKQPETFRLQNLSGQAFSQQILVAQDQHTTHVYRGLRGMEVLGAATPISSVGWFVVVELPTAEAYLPTRQMLMVMAGAIILITVVGVGIGFLFARAIVSPLSHLTAAATKISNGQLDTKVEIHANNELGVLARAFNQMAQQLRASFDTLARTNIKLEQRVEARTAELKAAKLATDCANTELRDLNNQLEQRVEGRTIELTTALQQLKQSQLHLVQSEKMSALGQLVAGIAHEINNPVNFIHGNLVHVKDYTQELLQLIQLFCDHFPDLPDSIQIQIDEIDLPFLQEDLIKVLKSMQMGTERIRELVLSLRNFSRLDEAEVKSINVHEGIDNTLTILEHRLKAKPDHPTIQIIKNYAALPLIECYAGQLNQVFMNILANAIDALEDYMLQYSFTELQQHPATIWIWTEMLNSDWIAIHIADNGPGISDEVRARIFDPFFTTKAVGKGTGLGLSISYQIITERHGGRIYCQSSAVGTEFVIEIPVRALSRQLSTVAG